ncbi:divisome protein SepX/GlpR [Streptomyces zingiberis]|uniref:DUF1275 domain-containing protein n=1 Tax=Streptomyces zingiberis TaxID=2053010 RepID=A0ABX1BYS1_9ACTN|nr:gephyrin-like molybdotransferase receptor GlpR [Streptomyces zingiberis]NJP99808.1 hypothetical protein [Streptomyces zingiberis]
MSSSGLIYAVIVGAWAAYLVPMWLRRQDELNEARPTERFSTAIRLLSGRAAMERRYAKDLAGRHAGEADGGAGLGAGSATPGTGAGDPDAPTGTVDVRDFALSAAMPVPGPLRGDGGHPGPARPAVADGGGGAGEGGGGEGGGIDGRAGRRAASVAERARRSKVLARRRRTTMVLFLAFALGAVVAAVGGLAFLWAPAVPAVLLSSYIVHLRAQERRRFAFTMDQRRAEAAAQQVRERGPRGGRRPARPAAADEGAGDDEPGPVATPEPAPASPHTAGRRALVEQTDHAEWVDQQRERGRSEGESWEPVPVPLPTYVTAPVAPRAATGLDLDAPGAWSSARSAPAGSTPQGEVPASRPADGEEEAPPAAPERRRDRPRRGRDRDRTPLFDQYADEDRPRAANE